MAGKPDDFDSSGDGGAAGGAGGAAGDPETAAGGAAGDPETAAGGAAGDPETAAVADDAVDPETAAVADDAVDPETAADDAWVPPPEPAWPDNVSNYDKGFEDVLPATPIEPPSVPDDGGKVTIVCRDGVEVEVELYPIAKFSDVVGAMFADGVADEKSDDDAIPLPTVAARARDLNPPPGTPNMASSDPLSVALRLALDFDDIGPLCALLDVAAALGRPPQRLPAERQSAAHMICTVSGCSKWGRGDCHGTCTAHAAATDRKLINSRRRARARWARARAKSPQKCRRSGCANIASSPSRRCSTHNFPCLCDRAAKCPLHKAGGRCVFAGCHTTAVSRASRLCQRHGAFGVCRVPGCSTNAKNGARRTCNRHSG